MGTFRSAIAALGVLTVLGLAGCTGAGKGSLATSPSPSTIPSATATGSAPATSPAATPGLPGSSPPPAVPPPNTGGGVGGTTLRGTAVEAEQKGCVLMLAQDQRTYLLLGGDRRLIADGNHIEVVGEVVARQGTTCREGIPFQVAQVRKI